MNNYLDDRYRRLADAVYRQEMQAADLPAHLPPLPSQPKELLQAIATETERLSVIHPGRGWGWAIIMEEVAQQAELRQWEGQAAVWQAWAANLWVKMEVATAAAEKAERLFGQLKRPTWQNVAIWLQNAQPWMINPQEAREALIPLQAEWPTDEAGRKWLPSYLCSLAWAYLLNSQIEQAFEVISTAEAICKKENDLVGLARCPFLRGAVLRNQGQYEEALEQYDVASKLIDQTDATAFAARVWCGYGYALRQGTNRLVEALNCLQRAAGLASAADVPYWQAMARNAQIIIYRYQGRLEEARNLCRQVRHLFKEQQAIPGLIESLINSSAIYYELGQYQVALSYVQEGLLLQQQDNINVQYLLTLRMNSGILEWQLGRFQRALQQLEDVRRTASETDFAARAAEINIYLAYVWHDLEEHDKAQAAYEAAYEIIAELDNVYLQYNLVVLETSIQAVKGVDDTLVTFLEGHVQAMGEKGSQIYQSLLMQLQAQILLRLGRFDEAHDLLQSCLLDFQHMGMRGAQATTYLWLGHIFSQREEFQLAAMAWQDALVLSEQQPQIRWQVHIELARLTEQQDEVEQTVLAHYQQAVSTLATMRQSISQPGLLSGYLVDGEQAVYDALTFVGDIEPEQTLLLLEMSKAHALAVQIRQEVLLAGDDPSAELQALRQQLFALQQEILRESNRIQRMRRQRDWLKLIREYDQLQAEYERSRQAVMANGSQWAYFQLDSFRQQMGHHWGANWLAIDYHLYGDVLRMVIVSPENLKLVCREVVELSALLEMVAEPQRLTADDLSALAALLLPEEVCQRLTAETVLLIAPHSRLHNIPWAALLVEDRPLVSRCQPLITPALHVFSALYADAPRPVRTGLLTAVAEFPGRPYAPLPLTLTEAGALQQRPATSAGILWRVQQQETAVWGQLQRAHEDGRWEELDCWHIATHAFFSQHANARACGLALYDQDIWLDDLVQLAPLPPLITLSACLGLPSKVFAGDDHVGLVATCLAAGSKNVVGSLWKMRDDASQELFVPFYQKLVEGASPLAALVKTQREMIAQGRPLSWWGGMQIIGRGV